ncbi:acyl-CoA synthetase [Stella sp.]|uniref:acyl-CoA synthetase n=1 Tax=Stella sp. TaxID=2912054 RepID=UPI0035B325A1
MLQPAADYAALAGGFHWSVPDRFNIGTDVADRPATTGGDRPALIWEDETGRARQLTFGEVARLSNRLANAFVGLGLATGDRIGILLAQGPETALAHVAAYKAGLIAVPLFTLFGPEALEYRLADSGTRLVVTDLENAAKLAPLRDRLPALAHIVTIDGGDLAFWPLLERAADRFAAVDTAADDPALIIYTSGTTGPPKGALHAHRVLLGHLPGVELPHDFFPRAGDRFWTPADWAWIGGLLDVLLPAWHHGVPVVAHRARKFDPEAALALMARHDVRNVFFPPTALKLLRQSGAKPPAGFRLRSVGSGGETLGAELLDWGRATLGVTVNEFYGQTECNLVVANSAGLFPVRPGSMGRPVPGHVVAIVDGEGSPLPVGATGNIAIRRPDPVMFLGYWNNAAATAAKFAGDWLLTGDLGRADADGWLHYVGRDDDVITSAGYRIGPGEVEDCLLGHPAVAMAAVVGVPDAVRTEAVMAWIVLKPGHAGSDALAEEIRGWVRGRLAAHEYPRRIAFVDALPMTATGKIVRRELRRRAASGEVPPGG